MSISESQPRLDDIINWADILKMGHVGASVPCIVNIRHCTVYSFLTAVVSFGVYCADK